MICPNCENEIAKNIPQCPNCGCHFVVQTTPKPQAVVGGRACPICGKTIVATAAFCKHCGPNVVPQQKETKPVQKQEEEKPAPKPQEVVPKSETSAVAAQAAAIEITVKFCKHCGKPRNANAAFCKWCGARS